MDSKEWAKDLIGWFDGAENYSVVQYAAERGISKKELEEMCGDSEEFRLAYEYGLTVMEYKITDGALGGKVKEGVAMRILETYCGVKGAGVVVQNNEYRQYMMQAKEKAEEILGVRRVADDGGFLVEGDDSLKEGDG